MLAINAFRRARPLAVALIALAALSACNDDDPTEPEDEPDVASVRLTVGSSSVTVSTTNAPTLDLAAGSNSVTAQWLRPDGSVESLVSDAEFELRIEPVSGTSLTWMTSGAFAGTLIVSGLSSGQTAQANVVLFHKLEQHEDFGPLPFTVRVP